MNWHDYFNQYFYRLTDEEATLWEQELIRKNPGIRQSDLEDAVRALESTDRPKLKDMLRQCSAIMQAKLHSEFEDVTECAMCYKGWIHFTPARGKYSVNGCSIPCLCSLGQRWLHEKYEPRHYEKLRRMAGKAMEQKRIADREAERFAEQMRA